jgi:hypothetical protein
MPPFLRAADSFPHVVSRDSANRLPQLQGRPPARHGDRLVVPDIRDMVATVYAAHCPMNRVAAMVCCYYAWPRRLADVAALTTGGYLVPLCFTM